MKQNKQSRQRAKVEKVMHEFKLKKLKTPQGKTVRKRSQAIAIAISEANKLK